MVYEKCCRNCEHAYLETCKGCDTLGGNTYQNFELRKELAKIERGEMVEMPCIEPVSTSNFFTGEPRTAYNILYRDKLIAKSTNPKPKHGSKSYEVKYENGKRKA